MRDALPAAIRTTRRRRRRRAPRLPGELAVVTSDAGLLRTAMDDRLHQPYRLPAAGTKMIEEAYEHGAAGRVPLRRGPQRVAICDSPIARSGGDGLERLRMAGMATRLRFDTGGARLSTPETGPMSLVTLTGIAKITAPALFENVNRRSAPAGVIAIVGPNGAGRRPLPSSSTEREADAGTVTRQGTGDRYLARRWPGTGPDRRGRGARGRGGGERDRRRMRHIEAEMAEAGGNSPVRTSWPS